MPNRISSQEQMEDEAFRLCYVDRGNTAIFTDGAFDDLHTDDWSRVPYEHNAMVPHDVPESEDEILQVDFIGYFDYPSDFNVDLGLSANDITIKKKVPWLQSPVDHSDDEFVRIYAGTSLPEFIDTVQQAGGQILIPLSVMQE